LTAGKRSVVVLAVLPVSQIWFNASYRLDYHNQRYCGGGSIRRIGLKQRFDEILGWMSAIMKREKQSWLISFQYLSWKTCLSGSLLRAYDTSANRFLNQSVPVFAPKRRIST
jgi:hypothetical protein